MSRGKLFGKLKKRSENKDTDISQSGEFQSEMQQEDLKELYSRDERRNLEKLTDEKYLAGDAKGAFRVVENMVEQGDDRSLVKLGYYYFYGRGVERNAEKARELFQRAEQSVIEKVQSKGRSALADWEFFEEMSLEDLKTDWIEGFYSDDPFVYETYVRLAMDRGLSDDEEFTGETLYACGTFYEDDGFYEDAERCYLDAGKFGNEDALEKIREKN